VCFVYWYMYFSIFSKLIDHVLLMCGCLYDEIKIYIYIYNLVSNVLKFAVQLMITVGKLHHGKRTMDSML